MQAPPPVPNLLSQIATMAINIQNTLSQPGIDWNYHPEDGGWSLTEAICHLRDVEIEVHQERFEAILAEENAFLPGVSADEWAEIRRYQEQDGETAFGDFFEARKNTIQMLQDLPPDSWKRQGRHSFFGPTSMHEILFLQARHDAIHQEQIRSIVEEQQLEHLA
jgi:hypothetical protein